MIGIRMIPCLLLADQSFVKTTQFQNPRYLGDPINIVRIFNEKEVDELCILDIAATSAGRPPAFDYLADLAEECFMPLSYGGGLHSVEDCRRVIGSGFEKIVLNSQPASTPQLVAETAQILGSQAVAVSIDVRKDADGGYRVWTHGGRHALDVDPVTYARRMAELGAGELLLNAVDRDGTMAGYDTALIRAVSDAVDIPVIACGGARDMNDMVSAVRSGGASAVAAGALFVFYGRHRAVLINPPTFEEFELALTRALTEPPAVTHHS